LVRELAAERGLTLIFVRTQRGADRLTRNLKQQGFHVGSLHGGMSQPQRERALGHFASGSKDVLVATDVAARGLDLEDITHVINFDAPADDKAYVHRVGRTARAGRGGEGITFVTPEQRRDVQRIAKDLDLHAEFVEAGLSVESKGGQAPKQQHHPGQRHRPAGGNRSRSNQSRRSSSGRKQPRR
jgi:ATP-dependent RNA helicase RhlE